MLALHDRILPDSCSTNSNRCSCRLLFNSASCLPCLFSSPHHLCRYHAPSIYAGSLAPGYTSLAAAKTLEPVYWFVDMMADYQVGVPTPSASLALLLRLPTLG